MDLADFLKARLDEDESLARTSTANPVTRFGPERMLREVAAKRAIEQMHRPTSGYAGRDLTYPAAANFCGFCGPGDNWQAEQEPQYFPGAKWPCFTMRQLAAVYSGHPDYQPEWKP